MTLNVIVSIAIVVIFLLILDYGRKINRKENNKKRGDK